tara:strand:- start:26 stop:286 length:261 start_codon:yes stop_codon:yes gene_type:complete
MINYIFLFFSFFLSQDIVNKIDTTIKLEFDTVVVDLKSIDTIIELEFDTVVVDDALIDTLSIQNDYKSSLKIDSLLNESNNNDIFY